MNSFSDNQVIDLFLIYESLCLHRVIGRRQRRGTAHFLVTFIAVVLGVFTDETGRRLYCETVPSWKLLGQAECECPEVE